MPAIRDGVKPDRNAHLSGRMNTLLNDPRIEGGEQSKIKWETQGRISFQEYRREKMSNA